MPEMKKHVELTAASAGFMRMCCAAFVARARERDRIMQAAMPPGMDPPVSNAAMISVAEQALAEINAGKWIQEPETKSGTS